jgi:curved DNA-binding protein CbpA
MALDPYRTLGLQPGATPAEVKRAYRRLAKAFHPDSAGAAELPRFLAIHEAYERLTSGRRAGRGSAGAAGPGGSGPEAGPEPWRADPSRARQAREQARARSRKSSSGPASASGSGGSTRTGGPSSSTRGGAGGGAKARTRRKATLGSTSYDEAREASDTSWAGASWYGPTSGEYWRVNPREYADPRKHGPEYQSRARRGSTTAGEAWDPDSPPADEPVAGPGRESGGSAEATGSSASRAWAPNAREADAGERRYESVRDQPEGPSEAFANLGRLLDTEPRDPLRRFGYALVAWAPLGLASAAVIGQATGCATYSAGCTGAVPLLPWLAQAFILGLLLLVPRLARILAVGAAGVVVAMVPLTGLMLAFGGSGDPQAPALLQTLVTVAWVIGVAVGVVGITRARHLASP